jgi:hypothetical protein
VSWISRISPKRPSTSTLFGFSIGMERWSLLGPADFVTISPSHAGVKMSFQMSQHCTRRAAGPSAQTQESRRNALQKVP